MRFTELDVPPEVQEGIRAAGFTTATPAGMATADAHAINSGLGQQSTEPLAVRAPDVPVTAQPC